MIEVLRLVFLFPLHRLAPRSDKSVQYSVFNAVYHTSLIIISEWWDSGINEGFWEVISTLITDASLLCVNESVEEKKTNPVLSAHLSATKPIVFWNKEMCASLGRDSLKTVCSFSLLRSFLQRKKLVLKYFRKILLFWERHMDVGLKVSSLVHWTLSIISSTGKTLIYIIYK